MNISVCQGAIFLIVQVNLKLVLSPLLIYIQKKTRMTSICQIWVQCDGSDKTKQQSVRCHCCCCKVYTLCESLQLLCISVDTSSGITDSVVTLLVCRKGNLTAVPSQSIRQEPHCVKKKYKMFSFVRLSVCVLHTVNMKKTWKQPGNLPSSC